jgi:predicted nucleotidyltransferase
MQKLNSLTILDRTVKVLDTEPDLKVAIIYGSVVSKNMREDSDVDLAVLFDTPMDVERKMQLIARLERELSRNVDLVDLASISGTILQQILCKGQILLKNDTSALARLLQKMVYHQTDMMPYVRRTLLERQRRFVNG